MNKNRNKNKKNGKSVYILESFAGKTKYDCRKGHYATADEWGSVGLYRQTVGVYSSVESAELDLRILVRQENANAADSGDWQVPRHFGFTLTERYLDDSLYGEDMGTWANVSEFESVRSYLGNGELNCFSDLDARCEKAFFGRDVPIVNVKPGEFALALCSNKAVPVLVGEVSFTKDEWSRRFDSGVGGDYTDDSGVVFFPCGGHEHPFSPFVFPLSCLPHYGIPRKTVSSLKRGWKEYYGKSFSNK